jgi:diguanylate cyclase
MIGTGFTGPSQPFVNLWSVTWRAKAGGLGKELGASLFIRLFAAKGPVDFIVRFMVLMLLVNSLNVAQALYFDRGQFMPLWNYVRGATVVATPFVVLVIWLISSLDNLQSRLSLMVRTDQMTGLLQRHAFMETVTRLYLTTGGVFLMLDVDHFKSVNDRFGHGVGDDCLIAVAQRIQRLTRARDVIGRLGGEEFGVFLVGAPDSLAIEIGERLAEGVAVAVAAIGGQVTITMSVGAFRGGATQTIQQVYSTADQALYRAKAEGRARLVFHRAQDLGTTFDRTRLAS